MADAKHGIEISLHIGQRVRRRDHAGKRVTGIVNSLQVESERGLTASVILDEPIIIPARRDCDREIRINWQTCPLTELSPFDERDEQIRELLAALQHVVRWFDQLKPEDVARYRVAIAKVTGSAS